MRVLIKSGKHECFGKKWRILKVMVDKVIESVLLDTNKPTLEEYMSGYTIVYDSYRCNECAEDYYEAYKKILRDYVTSTVLPELEGKSEEILLKELLQQWRKYKTLQNCLSKMFQSLDKYFIYSLGETSHLIFYDKVYGKMNNQVSDALIYEINRDRNGEAIDHALMKKVVEIYFIQWKSMKYYVKDFEEAMLADTAKFYSRKALEWLLLSCSDAYPYVSYMQKVERSMKEEETRITNSLDPRSVGYVLKVLYHELVEVYERKLQEIMVKQK